MMAMALPVRRHSAVAQWNPLREFEDLAGRMNQLIESAYAGLPDAVGTWSPAVDVEEVDDAYVIEAELPGVKRGDVDLEVREHELAITGEVKERERVGVLRRRARRTGHFDYRVSLPSDADPEKVEASLHDGVLTVRVSKSADAKPRRIPITAS